MKKDKFEKLKGLDKWVIAIVWKLYHYHDKTVDYICSLEHLTQDKVTMIVELTEEDLKRHRMLT